MSRFYCTSLFKCTKKVKKTTIKALLVSFRNLSIPAQNKPKLIADGIIDVVMPMLNIPTFPVVFKLLGTLRMLVDGQGKLKGLSIPT